MPRERAKLSDKQERILVQCQLMGLTPQDMQQISNRLIALQKEADEIKSIGETIYGFTWNKDDKGRWTVITPEGYHCEFTKGKNGRTHYWEQSWEYNVKVTKPGTVFKTRYLQKKNISYRNEWKAKLCPEKSKELYGMISWARNQLKWDVK